MSAKIRKLFDVLRLAGFSRTCCATDFRRDPLAHPVLDRMSMTELSDIPPAEMRARGLV